MESLIMYQETMAQIHSAANERHMLYRTAARQGLTNEQTRRLRELNDQLPMLWDRYRREYASRSRAANVPVQLQAA
jgi:hypothetical protein